MSRKCVMLAAGLVLLTLAARADKEDPKPTKVDIRGKVESVTAASKEAGAKGTLGVILVEGKKEKDTGYDKASVRITKTTKLEKMVGKKSAAAKFEDLKKGVKVEVTFTGPVAESYPVQAMAGSLLILE